MAVIFVFSTSIFGGSETGSVLGPIIRFLFPGVSESEIGWVHFAVRKAAHLSEYAALALLWQRGLVRGSGWTAGRSAFVALAISALYAVSDEFHQSFVPNRTPSALDVLIDTAGASSALIFSRLINKKGRL